MNKISIVFLQIVVILIGAGALAALIIFPLNEGRNVNADLATIYFKDPFLAYIYLGSTAFFVAVYNALKVLGYVNSDRVFSVSSVKAIQTIRYCAYVIIGFIIGAEIFIVTTNKGEDDIAGGVAMGVMITFISLIIVATTIILEKILVQKLKPIKEDRS